MNPIEDMKKVSAALRSAIIAMLVMQALTLLVLIVIAVAVIV
jgi:hypothetical protein